LNVGDCLSKLIFGLDLFNHAFFVVKPESHFFPLNEIGSDLMVRKRINEASFDTPIHSSLELAQMLRKPRLHM
jgi:hypothetical protein